MSSMDDDINSRQWCQKCFRKRTSKQLDKKLPDDHPRNLIPELCHLFYDHRWVTGTGGGISIRVDNKIYIAPSGVQKERIQGKCVRVAGIPVLPEYLMKAEILANTKHGMGIPCPYPHQLHQDIYSHPDDLFVQTIDNIDIECPPPFKRLKKSQCTPLFMAAYKMADAGAVIHTHSKHAVMATLLYPGTEFRITHQEMIKGIKKGLKSEYHRYDDELVVPIIENTPEERDLQTSMIAALEDYPETCAVLVRRHGVYVWGPTWEKAKTMCECYDYLFEVAVEMKKSGLDPCEIPVPPEGAYTQV